MPEHNWERVEEDSPDRCQAVIATKGQCMNRKMENSNYCPAHGGNRANKAAKEEEMRMYRIGKYQQRVNSLEDHGKIKSLRSEIAILRMMLEERLNQCSDSHDLMLHSQVVSNLVTNIEKLVTSCNRLDLQLGNMLDPTQAISWINEIVEIISTHIEDTEVLNTIADEILTSFQRIQRKESK